tara:strand:+ start:6105 stop:6917 length:813 start_codon:yes stop_codon:yes gene_type:complete
MFYDLMKKIYMFDPIKRYSAYKGYKCNAGRVSKNTVSQASGEFNFGEANRRVTSQIGEFADVYCVAKGKKPLAAMDYSVEGQFKLKKFHSKHFINDVVKYANYHNVKALHKQGKGRMYLKTVFYKKKNYKSALKLMDIIWTKEKDRSSHPLFKGADRTTISNRSDVAKGLLLGYKPEHILFFLNREQPKNKQVDGLIIKTVSDILKKMNLTLEDVQKHNIVVLDEIPYLTSDDNPTPRLNKSNTYQNEPTVGANKVEGTTIVKKSARHKA